MEDSREGREGQSEEGDDDGDDGDDGDMCLCRVSMFYIVNTWSMD